MRLPILATLSSAIPYPQDNTDGIITPTPTPKATITATDTNTVTNAPRPTRSKNPHREPIPIFSKKCTCDIATAQYPCWATDALQVTIPYLSRIPSHRKIPTLGLGIVRAWRCKHSSPYLTSDE
ncbi:hypothetical protein NX059_000125 [Plenodomus lindquistii]|nr:hypothetical protein NX059_000125 [Plenodomus lindquistii]